MTRLSWFDLSKCPDGTRVVFAEPHDIFPECIVPAGAEAVIKENGLNEIWSAMLVLPDDEQLRAALREWDGCVHMTGPEPGTLSREWFEDSPFTLAGVSAS